MLIRLRAGKPCATKAACTAFQQHWRPCACITTLHLRRYRRQRRRWQGGEQPLAPLESGLAKAASGVGTSILCLYDSCCWPHLAYRQQCCSLFFCPDGGLPAPRHQACAAKSPRCLALVLLSLGPRLPGSGCLAVQSCSQGLVDVSSPGSHLACSLL